MNGRMKKRIRKATVIGLVVLTLVPAAMAAAYLTYWANTFDATAVGPTRVWVSGRQLLVEGVPFTIKGVDYSPTPYGEGPGFDWWAAENTYRWDFPMLREMGANTILTYNAGTVVFPAAEEGYVIYSDGGLGENVGAPGRYGHPNGGAHLVLSEPFGNGCPEDAEKSWKYDYTNIDEGWAGFYCAFTGGAQDMSAYENLIFWVRWESGYTTYWDFEVVVEWTGGSSKHRISEYTSPTTSWRKVSIPLSDFTGIDKSAVTVPWNIVFSSGVTGGDAMVHIDYIRWDGAAGGGGTPTVEINATQEALDYAFSNDLYVIMGFWVPHNRDLSDSSVRENLKEGFAQMVNRWKHHPAVLMWAFGCEVDKGYAGGKADWYTLLQEAAQLASTLDDKHPVTTYNQELDEIGDGALSADDASLSALGVWGVNAYRGPGFGTLFTDYAAKTSKPLFMSEWGCDALDARYGTEEQAMQASYVESQWGEISANLSSSDPSNVCVGGTVFEWSDEWWKTGAWDQQDTTGQWANDAYYDYVAGEYNMNEDWWGITTINSENCQKAPRQAYYTLKNLWN